MSLTREQLMTIKPKFPIEKVPVPELGDGAEFTVRALSLNQYARVAEMSDKFQEKTITLGHLLRFNAAMALVDDNGDAIFDVDNDDDLAIVGSWPQNVTERISNVVNKIEDVKVKTTVTVDQPAAAKTTAPNRRRK